MAKRNTLTPQQTRALAALWEKWRNRNNSNLKLQRVSYSPYGAPYITIERRDDARKLGSWDWCITYYSEYDGQGEHFEWYSNDSQPMPAEIRNFLRKAWDKEFASIH
jgi:hypothetical protein